MPPVAVADGTQTGKRMLHGFHSAPRIGGMVAGIGGAPYCRAMRAFMDGLAYVARISASTT